MNLAKEFAKHNIDTFGVCDALDYNKAMGTEYKRCIVALFPYFCGYSDGSNLSIYTHGEDYHLVTRRILCSVADACLLGDYTVHSDTGPYIERTLAVKAGLCVVGRNGMCINQKYGSYFFIGYIACDADLEISKPLSGSCLGCMRCVAACPGGALADGFCEDRCLSAITQKKGELTSEERISIQNHNTVFGCDICQMVCPHNKGAEHTPIEEFKKDRITRLSLSDIEHMSAREFKKRYHNRAFAWRGLSVLKRNLRYSGDE